MRVVLATGGQVEDVTGRIAQAAREAIKFRLAVEAVPAEALPDDAGPIQDTRSWD